MRIPVCWEVTVRSRVSVCGCVEANVLPLSAVVPGRGRCRAKSDTVSHSIRHEYSKKKCPWKPQILHVRSVGQRFQKTDTDRL